MINKKPGGGITMNFSDEKDDLFLAAHNYSKEEALDGIKNLAERQGYGQIASLLIDR
jgi:hypothetical protein